MAVAVAPSTLVYVQIKRKFNWLTNIRLLVVTIEEFHLSFTAFADFVRSIWALRFLPRAFICVLATFTFGDNLLIFPFHQFIHNISFIALRTLRHSSLLFSFSYFFFGQFPVLIFNFIIHLLQCNTSIN